jgi:hypothetical protein
MDKVIKDIYSQDLTGSDIQITTNGKCPVHLYKDLLKYNSIQEILGEYNKCIVLFPVKSSQDGHWCCMIYHDDINTLEWFDPYGFSWDQELKYSEDTKWTQYNIIGQLMQKAQEQGIKTMWNKYRFQQLKDGINTCGKHSSIRARFSYLKIDEYAKLMLHQNETPDYLVSILTFITLRDNRKEENIVKNVLKKV